MKRSVLVLAMALVVGTAPSAGAQPEVDDCGAGWDRIVQLGASNAAIATPTVPAYLSRTSQTFALALPKDTEDYDAPESAALEIELSWPSAVSDFDLIATGPDGTEYDSLSINAIGGPTETVTVPDVGRCGSVVVEVLNFAGLPTEQLMLAVSATALE